jgi:hypothetical protein
MTTPVWDLSDKVKEAIRAEKVAAVDLLGEFEDDHAMCIRVILVFEDDTPDTETELWWCGPEGFAAAYYANNTEVAMDDFQRHLLNSLQDD